MEGVRPETQHQILMICFCQSYKEAPTAGLLQRLNQQQETEVKRKPLLINQGQHCHIRS